MAAESSRSKAWNCTSPVPACAADAMTARSCSLSERATARTRWPLAASPAAIARPSPRLAPVTMTLRIGAHQLSGSGHLESWHDAYQGGHLVRCQYAPAAVGEL